MNISIVGTIVKDRIVAVDGTITESMGGLFYSVEAMRAVSTPEDRITPISFVGSDVYEQVVGFWRDDHRMNLNGLYPIDQPNNHVELRYTESAERNEYSLDPMPSLTFNHVAPFMDADLLLVNMISGWDMALNDLQRLAAGFNGILSMDIHSLTLARKNDGLRVRRKPENLARWLAIPDIIQFNNAEFESFCHSGLTVFYKKYCFDQNKIVNLTLGNQGSISLFREKNEIVKIKTSPPDKINVIDPTGCGDVFLSAFAYTYYKVKNIIDAAKFANLAAAIAGTRRGLPQAQWLKTQLENNRKNTNA